MYLSERVHFYVPVYGKWIHLTFTFSLAINLGERGLFLGVAGRANSFLFRIKFMSESYVSPAFTQHPMMNYVLVYSVL